mmetsp:Transcript_16630/g.23288  ORF Transcript_16630/g.23288 Transcript_16630/m.23288 type:complete len:420 (-) Transcript_16630:131-1390(-)
MLQGKENRLANAHVARFALPKDYMGFKIKYHPDFENILGCVASQHFGLVGDGQALFYETTAIPERFQDECTELLHSDVNQEKNLDSVDNKSKDLKPHGVHQCKKEQPGLLTAVSNFRAKDCMFDFDWLRTYQSSVSSENYGLQIMFAIGCGDGSVQLGRFDPKKRGKTMDVLRVYSRHKKEISTVACWGQLLASGSWDGKCFVHNVMRQDAIAILHVSTGVVNRVIWNTNCPKSNNAIPNLLTASGDGSVMLWDLRLRASPRFDKGVGEKSSLSTTPQQTIKVLGGEVLSLASSPVRDFEIVTGCVDGAIRIFDIRKLQTYKNGEEVKSGWSVPVDLVHVHDMGVRDLAFQTTATKTPLLLTASYDMTVALLDLQKRDPLLGHFEHHSEFVYGVSWCHSHDSRFASCGWDEMLAIVDFK